MAAITMAKVNNATPLYAVWNPQDSPAGALPAGQQRSLYCERGAAMNSINMMTGISMQARVWKGGFHMCRVATTPPFDAHAHRCNESGCWFC